MRRRSRGFTIIEVLVVIAIIALMLTGATYGLRSISRTELRGSSAKLAGGIRYCFDRAITTGSYYRIVLDLNKNQYWAERSDERMYLGRDKEEAPGQGKAYDADAAEKLKDEQDAKDKALLDARGGIAASLEPPPKPKRAKFQTFRDTTLPVVNLKRIKLFDVFTGRQREPYTSGKAYLYFFPDGHTERAVVRLTDGDNFYSLVVHPLTGRVEVKAGKYDIPRDFDVRDDEGREVAPR